MGLSGSGSIKHKNNSMKKLTMLIVAIATITTLSLRAADDAKPARGKVSAEDLKKYDKNGDGKLDKDERAAMRADKAKEKKEAK
jgi:hypothetical protein